MQTAMAVSLIIFAAVCLVAYLSLWNAIDDIKNSLDYIKSTCNNEFEVKQSVHILRELISKSHKDLLTEIACLATKNNEDIKRAKEGFQAGDIIDYYGEETLVLEQSTRLDDVEYRLWNLIDGEFYAASVCVERDAKFLRRIIV